MISAINGGAMFRTARDSDTAALLSLWNRVFGDDETVAAGGLNQFAGTGNVFVADDNGTPVAMLLAVPCHIGSQRGIYLYALATEPDYRGNGIMSQLMAAAEQHKIHEGAQFSVLIPAEIPLFAYYKKRGYSQRLQLRVLQQNAKDADGARPTFTPVESNQLTCLRNQYLQGSRVEFDCGRLALSANDLNLSGACLAVTEEGYAVAFLHNSQLLISEMAATNDMAANQIINHLCHHFNQPAAQISLGLASPLFCQQGVLCSTAILKPLDNSFKASNDLYLRFALDDVTDIFNRPPDDTW